jgi:phosphohistidine phosphatase
MKILTLIRHAKSSWADPELADFDRPLNHRGQRDLPGLVQRMQRQGPRPDQLHYSPALRTRLTAEPLKDAFNLHDDEVLCSPTLYEADASTLLDVLRRLPDSVNHTMLVGHNPGLLELVEQLCPEAPERLPTGAIIQLQLMISHWSALQCGCARKLWLDYPKLHRSAKK